MKKIIAFILALMMLALTVVSLTGCNSKYNNGKHHVEMQIKNYGKIVFELDSDAAPLTVEHFLTLVKNGDYDHTYINRYQQGFVVQGGQGCKNKSTVVGEFSSNNRTNNLKHVKGVLSLARSDSPDSGSSQFFIVADTSDSISKSLDGNYAAFGYIIEGMDVLEKIMSSIDSSMYEYSYAGILMGFLASNYYIEIEKMTMID